MPQEPKSLTVGKGNHQRECIRWVEHPNGHVSGHFYFESHQEAEEMLDVASHEFWPGIFFSNEPGEGEVFCMNCWHNIPTEDAFPRDEPGPDQCFDTVQCKERQKNKPLFTEVFSYGRVDEVRGDRS